MQRRLVCVLETRKKDLDCSKSFFVWWPGAESNCRHADFQSAALPTELPGREKDCSTVREALSFCVRVSAFTVKIVAMAWMLAFTVFLLQPAF